MQVVVISSDNIMHLQIVILITRTTGLTEISYRYLNEFNNRRCLKDRMPDSCSISIPTVPSAAKLEPTSTRVVKNLR